MQGSDFLAQNPVFTTEQFREFQSQRGSTSQWTRKALLAHYERRQRITRIRRGVYAVVPSGTTPENAPVDPYLVASRLAPDAVLGYHTALSFHGRAHSVAQRFEFLTATGSRALTFRSWQFRPVLFPKVLRRMKQQRFGVQEAEQAGLPVRVTALERTLVDVLDRPDLGGGWEEIWRSLETVEFFDLDQIIEYATILGNATTAAKVGFFLEQHREPLMVEDGHLAQLSALRPKEPHYLDRATKTEKKLVAKWNLMVPASLIERSWEQVV
ncbi:MAG: type IV toxin-antitoxin system AbiEi family antitoxin [Tepidisphaerales bacterium]